MEWSDNSLPKADLKASQTLIGPGSTVKFSAACSQNTEEITWSLPESSSESAEGDSVSVTYDKEGVYDVTVTAKNLSGEDTKTVEGLVFVTSELEKDGELLLLSQAKVTEATAYVNANEAPSFAVDGDVTKKWCATGTPPHELTIDLGEEVAVSQVAIAHAEAGGESLDTLDLPVLIGISFFTFQSMSYLIDVYRRDMPATRSLTDFAFFTSFFPTLLAGPILRARTFLPQLRQPVIVTHQMMGLGTWFIIMGLFKKCIISDYISINFVSRIFDNPALYSGLENLLGVYGYALQLYCDFSGYSDMAIGIALWMGFHIPANFRAPYKSDSITDFWRRWHISLSTWLRDYLYISLGGNRCSRPRMYLNQFLTMLLGGLWHGASWNFVIWGSVHGVALCAHKAWQRITGHDKHYHPTGLRRIGAIILTFHIVCFSWLFFAGSSFEASAAMLTQIFTNFRPDLITQFVAGYPEVTALMLTGFALHFLPTRWNDRAGEIMGRTPSILLALLLVAMIIWVIQVKGSEIQPFIYFNF